MTVLESKKLFAWKDDRNGKHEDYQKGYSVIQLF